MNIVTRIMIWAGLGLAMQLTGCKEIDFEPEKILVDMNFTNTVTPRGPIPAPNVTSKVSLSGPDQCYKYSRLDIYYKETNRIEIRAKAEYPAPNLNVACEAIPVNLDTTIRINTKTKGEVYLEFYNQNTLFKRDTVTLN